MPLSEADIKLPQPAHKGSVTVEEALLKRRSVRHFRAETVTLESLSQLLWAAQGITKPGGYRTAPSAGATYPITVYVVAGNVANLQAGIYLYNPQAHKLTGFLDGDYREQLAEAALRQGFLGKCAVNIVFTTTYAQTTRIYGNRGIRYVHMEAGHAAQNVSLQAVALGLETVVVGAFHDERVAEILKLSPEEKPLYIIPIGH